MDLTSELIQESKEAYLNANIDDFTKWVRDNIGIEADFYTSEIIEYLKSMYWSDYLDDLETADNARLEVLR